MKTHTAQVRAFHMVEYAKVIPMRTQPDSPSTPSNDSTTHSTTSTIQILHVTNENILQQIQSKTTSGKRRKTPSITTRMKPYETVFSVQKGTLERIEIQKNPRLITTRQSNCCLTDHKPNRMHTESLPKIENPSTKRQDDGHGCGDEVVTKRKGRLAISWRDLFDWGSGHNLICTKLVEWFTNE